VTRDLEQSLETLFQCGVTRVLTSGGAPSAIEGVERIAALRKRAAGQVTVMAGGGLREETIQEVVHRSGVGEVHVRGARTVTVAMEGFPPRLKLRKALPSDEEAYDETDERRIREFVRLAHG
jgi:copper homeostasis protein